MNQSASFEYLFPLPNGLHARPASCIEAVVKKYPDTITLTNQRNGKTSDARSVLSMIASDVLSGDPLVITVTGESADQTLARFQKYLQTEFLACDAPLEQVAESGSRPLPNMLRGEELKALQGTSASPGVGRGKPRVLGEPELMLDVDNITALPVAQELARFDEARQRLNTELERLAAIAHAEEKTILAAHLSLLGDDHLVSHLTGQISKGLSTLAAVLQTQEHFVNSLRCSASSYLQERALDIRDICSRLIVAVYGEESYQQPDTVLNEDCVCVAETLTPSQFLALERRWLKGLVMESGGTTSHTVILARSFGIPVLVGIAGAKTFAADTCQLIVDADLGMLVADPGEQVNRYYELEQQKFGRLQERQRKYIGQPAVTQDGHCLEVAANIASAEEAETAFTRGAEGIGLFRTEMLFMDRSTPPSEEEQFGIYQSVLAAAKGRPVIIRTIDIGGDKPVEYLNITAEENPFLGYRAVRIYPEYFDLFQTQLRAILRAGVHGQCKIMVPMVATLAEAKWLRSTFNEAIAALEEEGVPCAHNLQLGIMLEVPSAVFIIDQLVQYVDFFSIGSNDLTQYMLAADRGNSRVQHLYNALEPSFLRLLKHVVDEVHKADSWVGLCGELAGNPVNLPLLLGVGLDEVSLGAPAIPQVKEVVCKLTYSECRQLFDQAIKQESAKAVTELLEGVGQTGAEKPILAECTVTVNAHCRSKAEVIKTLVDNLYINERVVDVQGTEDAIWDREVISPTMLGFGIAIPHCKSDSVAQNSVSIMKLAEPILWNEGDDVLTDTVFMLTVRASEAGSTHMKIFAQLARRIMRGAFRETLATCTSEQELLAFISQELEL